MVIESPLLLNTKRARVRKVVDMHMRGVFEQKLMINPPDSLFLEVNNVNPALRNIEYYDFFVVHLPKLINDIVILALVEYFALGIEMNNAFLLAGLIHPCHHKGVVKGGG